MAAAVGALADDVADQQRPLALGGVEDVVEVAADLVAAPGGAVAGGQLDAGDARELRRQQRALQLPGDLGLLREQADVVERQRGAGDEALGVARAGPGRSGGRRRPSRA